MMFVTGDMHRDIDISKLADISNLTCKTSTVLIAGDFGGVWNQGFLDENGAFKIAPLDELFINSLARFPFKIIACLGNHENYDVINRLPRTDAYGGKIIRLSDNVELLDRGYVYQIEGKKILSIGGAMSMDRLCRKEHITFWQDEVIQKEDINRARKELSKHDFKVDYVLTHTAPLSVLKEILSSLDNTSSLRLKLEFAIENDPSVLLLDELLKEFTFKQWYFGHFHKDMQFTNTKGHLFHCVYNDWKNLS